MLHISLYLFLCFLKVLIRWGHVNWIFSVLGFMRFSSTTCTAACCTSGCFVLIFFCIIRIIVLPVIRIIATMHVECDSVSVDFTFITSSEEQTNRELHYNCGGCSPYAQNTRYL